jgi:hypothetical protein
MGFTQFSDTYQRIVASTGILWVFYGYSTGILWVFYGYYLREMSIGFDADLGCFGGMGVINGYLVRF